MLNWNCKFWPSRISAETGEQTEQLDGFCLIHVVKELKVLSEIQYTFRDGLL